MSVTGVLGIVRQAIDADYQPLRVRIAPVPVAAAMIPVSVLTGFLGSGKTTVLARLLRRPEFSRTAVIINEFGEVGLDHDLVEASDESLVQLQTGCLCCAMRGDLVRTLEDLLRRREEGSVPPFERVLIETSGLADPAPILQSLMLDAALAGRLSSARRGDDGRCGERGRDAAAAAGVGEAGGGGGSAAADEDGSCGRRRE